MKYRIFIAIDLPDELKNIAEAYIELFYKENFVRIPKREGWHITLIFCGYLNETEIDLLKEIIEKIVSHIQSFFLVSATILFAPEMRPRMVWLKFQNSPDFAKLRKQIETEIIEKQKQGFFKNFREEKRTHLPHLTLARFDERYFHNFKNLLPQQGVDISEEAKPFLVDSIKIMESRLSRAGAEYIARGSFLFGS
jgi:2'-5' RNA ligase